MVLLEPDSCERLAGRLYCPFLHTWTSEHPLDSVCRVPPTLILQFFSTSNTEEVAVKKNGKQGGLSMIREMVAYTYVYPDWNRGLMVKGKWQLQSGCILYCQQLIKMSNNLWL